MFRQLPEWAVDATTTTLLGLAAARQFDEVTVMGMLTSLRRELREVALVSLYFFFWLSVFLLLKKLLLDDYQVVVSTVPTAAVGALILAKVVIVLDKTRSGTRFDARLPVLLAATYKTLIYIAATFVVLFLERLFHAYRESGALSEALRLVWEHKRLNLILAQVVCIGLAFAAYHVFAGLDRRLGQGTLKRLLLGRPTDGPASPRIAGL